MFNPFMQRGIQAQLEAMRFMFPDQYGQLVSEFQKAGSRESCVARLREMAAEKGIDLDMMARQYGIRL